MPDTPGVPDHAAPEPTTEVGKPEEPLRTAEIARALVLLAVGAKVIGVDLPDPVLDIVVDIVAGVVGLGVSAGLTAYARGQVWAKRRGIDLDAILRSALRRTGGAA